MFAFVHVCSRLLAFACVFVFCVCLRLSAFVCVCLRLLAFAYAPLCCAPLCVTLTQVFADNCSFSQESADVGRNKSSPMCYLPFGARPSSGKPNQRKCGLRIFWKGVWNWVRELPLSTQRIQPIEKIVNYYAVVLLLRPPMLFTTTQTLLSEQIVSIKPRKLSETENYQYSTEGQKFHQNLVPVLVPNLWNSLVFF